MAEDARTALETERVLRLSRATPFDALPPADLRLVASAAREQPVTTATTLVREGERAVAHWVPLLGVLQAVRGGARFEDARIASGFGGLSILSRQPMPCDLVAEPGSLLLVLDQDALTAALEEHGHLLRSVLRVLSVQLLGFRGTGDPGPGPNVTPPAVERLDLIERMAVLRHALHLGAGGTARAARLGRAARVRRLREGELLWSPGGGPADVYVPTAGTVELLLPDVERAVAPTFGALGMVECVAGASLVGTARARDDATVLVLPHGDVQDALEDDDAFCFDLVRLFALETWRRFWGTIA